MSGSLKSFGFLVWFSIYHSHLLTLSHLRSHAYTHTRTHTNTRTLKPIHGAEISQAIDEAEQWICHPLWRRDKHREKYCSAKIKGKQFGLLGSELCVLSTSAWSAKRESEWEWVSVRIGRRERVCVSVRIEMRGREFRVDLNECPSFDTPSAAAKLKPITPIASIPNTRTKHLKQAVKFARLWLNWWNFWSPKQSTAYHDLETA